MLLARRKLDGRAPHFTNISTDVCLVGSTPFQLTKYLICAPHLYLTDQRARERTQHRTLPWFTHAPLDTNLSLSLVMSYIGLKMNPNPLYLCLTLDSPPLLPYRPTRTKSARSSATSWERSPTRSRDWNATRHRSESSRYWPLQDTVITNAVWCIAYKREVGRDISYCVNRTKVSHQGGPCRWAGGINGWLIRAQSPRSKRISCKGQSRYHIYACLCIYHIEKERERARGR